VERVLVTAKLVVHEDTRAFREEIAWSELVALVRRNMRAFVGASPELEDLTQTALEQIVRSAHRFEGRADFRTFSYRICAHVAADHWRWWRRWLRRFAFEAKEAVEPVAPGDASEQEDERRRARRLHALLDRLDADKRLVITLADLEGMPASRIAEILEIPEPTVRSRLRQARIALAARVQKDPFFRDEVRR
jgi:RNA polymerase sigma-70 factor (ECF subfamily)